MTNNRQFCLLKACACACQFGWNVSSLTPTPDFVFHFSPGSVFSHMPPPRYLPRGSHREGSSGWDQPLRRAVHEELRLYQGTDPPVTFPQIPPHYSALHADKSARFEAVQAPQKHRLWRSCGQNVMGIRLKIIYGFKPRVFINVCVSRMSYQDISVCVSILAGTFLSLYLRSDWVPCFRWHRRSWKMPSGHVADWDNTGCRLPGRRGTSFNK